MQVWDAKVEFKVNAPDAVKQNLDKVKQKDTKPVTAFQLHRTRTEGKCLVA